MMTLAVKRKVKEPRANRPIWLVAASVLVAAGSWALFPMRWGKSGGFPSSAGMIESDFSPVHPGEGSGAGTETRVTVEVRILQGLHGTLDPAVLALNLPTPLVANRPVLITEDQAQKLDRAVQGIPGTNSITQKFTVGDMHWGVTSMAVPALCLTDVPDFEGWPPFEARGLYLRDGFLLNIQPVIVDSTVDLVVLGHFSHLSNLLAIPFPDAPPGSDVVVHRPRGRVEDLKVNLKTMLGSVALLPRSERDVVTGVAKDQLFLFSTKVFAVRHVPPEPTPIKTFELQTRPVLTQD